jgi:hypothetical protein
MLEIRSLMTVHKLVVVVVLSSNQLHSTRVIRPLRNITRLSSDSLQQEWRHLIQGKVVPALNYVPYHEDILCLLRHHATKTYGVGRSRALRILNLGTRWTWVVNFTPHLFYPHRNSPWYPCQRELDGPQSQSEHGGKELKSLPQLGTEPQSSSP